MTMPRRNALRIAALALLGAAGTTPAGAQGRRILEDSPEPTAPGLWPAGRLPELSRAVHGLTVGGHTPHGALSVFWLHGIAAPPLRVATLDEARASGTLAIAERDRATVPEVTVDNRGKAHVLLLAGEILVGGKQNRVLREDILLPPISGPRALGVYCVEQGRWNEGRRDFESKSSFAQPGLRRQVYDKADQNRVWSEVTRSAAAAAAPSSTSSYQEVYEQPAVRRHLDEVERRLDAPAAAGALGAAVFAGSALSGIDLFRDPDLFAREWRKLLRAHAVDVYGRPAILPVPEDKLRGELARLLGAAASVTGAVRGTPGVGRFFEFRLGQYRGAALAHDGGLVHAAIL